MDQEEKERKPHPITTIFSVTNSAIAAGSLLIAGATYWGIVNSPEKRLPIEVLSNSKPVAGAKVSLGIVEISPVYTDSQGRAFFQLKKEFTGRPGRITIRKPGFETYDEQLLLQPRPDSYIIHLEVERLQVPAREAAPPGNVSTEGPLSPINMGSGSVTVITSGSHSSAEKHKKQ